jgi:DNA-binding transcriptional LysR family regulator
LAGYTARGVSVNAEKEANTFKMEAKIMSYVATIKMFVRVYELGSMSAAARDQRTSPAVASARVSELEKHLGVRLFSRTTRSLQPTENGRLFYDGALKILDAISAAEQAITGAAENPRGTIFVAAPLGVGRRFIAPHVPAFKDIYPQIDVRLRLSDRVIDVTSEGLDLAFHMGQLDDSTLKLRHIIDCARVLCAAPAYIAARGMPRCGADLVSDRHACLNLRFPGAKEFQWALQTPDGPKRFEITGPYESDDGDVLTGWALDGRGVVLKPIFEVADYLRDGRLVPVATENPPLPTQLCCLFPDRRLKDPKTALFMEFMAQHIKDSIRQALLGLPDFAQHNG